MSSLELDSPAVLRLEDQEAAVIALTVPRSDLPKVMGPAVAELRSVLGQQGLAPTGPLFAHHLRMDDIVFDLELGFPTERAVVAAGRVRAGRLPAGAVAQTTYRGGYQGLGAAWGAFRRWIDDHGHVRTPDLWEAYALGPEGSPDPADWRTVLTQPLRA